MFKIVSFVIMVLTLVSLNAQNVGIGTQNPNAKLEVVGNGSTSSSNSFLVKNFIGNDIVVVRDDGVLFIEDNTNFRIQSRSAGGFRLLGEQGNTPDKPSIGFFSTNGVDDGAGGMGIYRPLANTMAFSTLSTERMRINPGGNIGIGTSSPTNMLHIAGDLRVEDRIIDGTNSSGVAGQVLSSTGSSTEWINATGLGGDDDWTVSGSDMYPTTATNIGIGTTSPLHPLHIRETGPNQISQDDYTFLVHSSAVTGLNADSAVSTKVHLEHGSGAGDVLVRAFQAYGQSNSWSGTTTVIGAHAQSNYVFSGGGAPINTHIGVFGEASTDNAVGTQIMIGGRFSAVNGDENLAIQTTNGGVQLQVLGGGGTQMVVADNNGNLAVQALPSLSDDDWTVSGSDMYPTTATNVGIGTTAPNYTFEVQGANTSSGTAAIYGENVPPASFSGWGHGVYGKIESGSGYTVGVRGTAIASSPNVQGRAYGVYGQASNANDGYNYGVFGRLDGSNGGGAVTGWDQVSKPGWLHNTNGYWAGFFAGDVHVTDKLAINENSPTHDLHINGDMRLEDSFVDGTNSAGTSGQILSSTGSSTEWVDPSTVVSAVHPIEPYGASFTLTTNSISSAGRIYFQRFIASSTGKYSKIKLFLDNYGSSNRVVNVAIFEKSGSSPGQLLAEGSLTGIGSPSNDDIIEINIDDFQTGFVGYDLVAGEQYFVAVLLTGSGFLPTFWGQADVSSANNWNKFSSSTSFSGYPAAFVGGLSSAASNFWFQIAE